MNLDELKFDENGLIPAIVVDDETGKVLTLAYMNRESLAISMEKKLTCFWSRSRQELWLKGETSGHYQHIVSITADCDYDALEVRVNKDGPACHLGTDSCFTNPVLGENKEKFRLEGLYQLLEGRKKELPEGSYTTYLFQKGLDKILKKVGEESTEVIIAGKAQDKAETVYEIADLAYHVLVLMVELGITVDVEETGTTFAENAMLKAKTICAASGLPAIADDSGLCVDALNGAPGVYSARYGGPELDDVGRYKLLLENLRGQLDRRGKFVSAICCCFPNGDKVEARGECPGAIAYAPKGEGGFGYDPVFFIPGLKKTFAELTTEEKNAISHRGNALNKFKTELENYLNGTDQ